jgi:peptidoglycan biosynthesis protein MviN/MurJ (putative lipid II flippase)
MDGLASEASAGIRMVLYVVAPTAIALGCLALPVLNVLYRHGQLAQTPGAVETAVPLVGLMASCILFSSVGEVLILCLLALKRVWSLLVVQALSLAASVGLCWQMTKWLGLPGLAGAVSLTALVTLGLLFGMVERYIKIHDWQEMGQFAWKTFLACVVVWAWLHFLAGIVASRGGVSGVFPNAAEIAVGVVISAMLYIAVSERLRIPEWLAARAVVERVVQRHNVDEAFRSAED